ncbi:MAG TPA: nucleotidyltransferase domain-containing protein [Ignavibacteriales bacterium]|nr:nucleotidyltransferase domain-containing protein [Ignavibacteriales bacterium]
MHELDKNILLRIKNIVLSYGKVDKIILFGSRAKGTAKQGSDIDIALVGSNLSFSEMCRILNEIEELNLPYKVDIIQYDSLSNEDIKKDILKFGIAI